MTDQPQHTPDEDEHTMVVSRDIDDADDADEHTVMVERAVPALEPDDERDHTVVVDRAVAGDGDGDEHTVVVDRADADDHTVMVERGVPALEPDDEGDHTVVVDRAAAGDGDGDEHTVVVDRADAQAPAITGEAGDVAADGATPPGKGRVASPSNGPAGTARPASKRRRGLTPPPVPEGFGPRAVDAMGAGATETYDARVIPQITAVPVALEEGPQATRAAAPSMPSVARNSRRAARIAVATYAAAWVVAVLGIATIGFFVLR